MLVALCYVCVGLNGQNCDHTCVTAVGRDVIYFEEICKQACVLCFAIASIANY